ncbi:hypothetical protein DFA_12035 [Cavenderia fasciculata]|uniref:Queuine tRNA-ribosyltransferase accessory subunit 2 n=1 Tax=Cavenderia fasciculata TaxID=261658 RepID=F4QFG4_CACFS|nr:uncharacterized protein DFA_12035 [Cavenderia fasciculata]EGG14265.1 hypothetical protein DFA_12035 [Cavenderia fasciculata]|eukprot:XP_004350974.1 hypothetical protein DFA_12035 [Cavenderia fasciculata]
MQTTTTTTDYLRQFNKEAPSQLYPFHIGSNSLSHHSYITPSSSSFNNNNDLNIDAKDRQICDQSNLIQKLKSIIYNSADDLLINQMNIAFSESTYYKLTAPPEIPSLSFHGLGESAFPPVIGGQFGRAGSPRKETSQPPLTPASITSNIPQQQQQPTQHKSPRKLNSSSSSNNITNGIGGISGSLPPLTSVASSSSNSAALNNLANSFGSLTGGGSKIKKSPSMPTITKNNNNNNNNNSINSLSNNQPSHSFDRTNKPPLTKSSSNTNISGLHKGDVSPPKGKSNSNNNLVDQQQMPRKQMTKSVSMGAIVNQQDLPIKCTSLEEITGQIYHLTKYQAGCRFLQKKLEENPDSEHVTLIFNEVFEHIQSCLLDPYGQYLIPQLMKYCSSAQRRMIVDRIAPMVETFACHIYGIHEEVEVMESVTLSLNDIKQDEKSRSTTLTITDSVNNTKKEIQTPAFILYTKQGSPDNLTKDLLNSLPYWNVRTMQLLLQDIVQFKDTLQKYGKGAHSFLSLQEHILYLAVRDSNTYQENTFNDQSFNVLARKGNVRCPTEDFIKTVLAAKPDFVTSLSFDNYWSTSQKKLRKQLDYSTKQLDTLLSNQSVNKSTVFANIIGGKNEELLLKYNKDIATTKSVGGYTLANYGTNETIEERTQQIPKLVELLPSDKPILITGIGAPEQVLSLIEMGIDLFSTNYPNTLTEFGHALTFTYKYDDLKNVDDSSKLKGSSKMNLWDVKYVIDATPIYDQCPCFTCKNHTRAYIHHLLNTHEMTAQVLLTIHNVSHYTGFFVEIQNSIKNSSFKEYKDRFILERSKE